ncbi:MAG TPA: FAD-binding oxidoreductase, partial [Burkholderiaceae bacterium]|nr:FAD-binding oxidoreductase [Burkholderiaceae bacterium]
MPHPVLDALRAALPADALEPGPIDARHLRDWNVPAKPGTAPIALVRARGADEVAAVLRICDAHRHPVVPQAGLTG